MRLQAVYLIHCHDVQWCKVCSLFISGSNKTYSFIVVISSTVKYKSSMLIWVLHVDKMTSTQTFTMARWEIVVKKSNATRQTKDQKQQQRKQKKKENNNKTKQQQQQPQWCKVWSLFIFGGHSITTWTRVLCLRRQSDVYYSTGNVVSRICSS